MKQVWIPKAGDPAVLELREAPDPEPGQGEVRIAVEAAGINFADLMARMGVYPDAPPMPFVPGYEVAGRIDAVGPGVDEARIGQPVLALVRFGGYSSAVILPDSHAVSIPDGVSMEHAASIPVTGLTAWMLCEVMGRVREGDRVLVHSAGGGVGLMALDLLKWRGAFAIGTASAGKHDRLRERGYDQLIDYRTEDFEAVLRDDPGLDLVLDPVGGESWAKGMRLLRPGGRLGVFGFSASASSNRRSVMATLSAFLAVPWLKINPLSMMSTNTGVFGVNMGHLWEESDRVLAWLAELLGLVEQGIVRPHVHASFPLEDAARAHASIHARENFGKVLLIP